MSLLTYRPPEGSKRWPSRRARGWGSPWGDRTAVEGGGRRLWLVKWGSTWPKHKTSQHFQNTRKINATTYRIDGGDERYEGRWVVKVSDGRLGSYSKEKDAAAENPIVTSVGWDS